MPEHFYAPYMRHAIVIAHKALYQTAPNPCVGAVIIRDNAIVAEGWHKGPGHPHAEIEALAAAKERGISLSECTLVVTLEPCSHQGKTPPCTHALIESGIRHVVIGTTDPTTNAGGGAEILRNHGITVEINILDEECRDLIDDFLTWQTKMPYTILKLASTLDGRIATRTGHSQWVSAPETRESVHALRRHMQAIIVGGNTFYSDDPKLTCRNVAIDEGFPQPLAIVVTSRLPDASSSYCLVTNRPESTIFWTTVATAASPKAESLRKKGIRVLGLPSNERSFSASVSGMRSSLNLADGFRYLFNEVGCYYVLCEGGGNLGMTLLEKELAKEFHLHLAPKILGDNSATPLFDGRSPDTMAEAMQMRILKTTVSGSDIVLTLKPVGAKSQQSHRGSD